MTSGKQKSVGEQNNELVVVDLPKNKWKKKKDLDNTKTLQNS